MTKTNNQEGTMTYKVEFSVYGVGSMSHVFYGPASRVETAKSKDEAKAQALAFARAKYPDRTFEIVAVDEVQPAA